MTVLFHSLNKSCVSGECPEQRLVPWSCHCELGCYNPGSSCRQFSDLLSEQHIFPWQEGNVQLPHTDHRYPSSQLPEKYGKGFHYKCVRAWLVGSVKTFGFFYKLQTMSNNNTHSKRFFSVGMQASPLPWSGWHHVRAQDSCAADRIRPLGSWLFLQCCLM